MIDSRPAHSSDEDVAIVATLHARLLGASVNDVRAPIRSGREGALLCLVVDASGSMGARRRLARVKGALLELLRDAYARRDRVGMIAFSDRSAEIVIAPGAPLERAAEAIRALPAGGRTPLAAGLDAARAPDRERGAARAWAARDRGGADRWPRAGPTARDPARGGAARAHGGRGARDRHRGRAACGSGSPPTLATAAGAHLHRLLARDATERSAA